VFIVFTGSCLGLLSCIKLCFFAVSFVIRKPSDWLGRLYSSVIFRVEGFPLQRPD